MRTLFASCSARLRSHSQTPSSPKIPSPGLPYKEIPITHLGVLHFHVELICILYIVHCISLYFCATRLFTMLGLSRLCDVI